MHVIPTPTFYQIFFFYFFYPLFFYIYYSFPYLKNISRTESVQVLPSEEFTSNLKLHSYPTDLQKEIYSHTVSKPILFENNEQKKFLEKLEKKQCKIVQVLYDRIAQNPKELTVTQHEYLEVKRYSNLKNNIFILRF